MKFIISILVSILFTFSAYSAPSSDHDQDIWGPMAKEVCQRIEAAVKLYHNGKVKEAHLASTMAYFKCYDANMEPAVRVNQGGPHVFAIEGQFHQLTKAMVVNPTPAQTQQVDEIASSLCKAIAADAQALNKDNVQRQLFKVEQ